MLAGPCFVECVEIVCVKRGGGVCKTRSMNSLGVFGHFALRRRERAANIALNPIVNAPQQLPAFFFVCLSGSLRVCLVTGSGLFWVRPRSP